MQTYTGEQFYPLDPEPDKIHIIDIAHALSMKCRYSGHCQEFYSVAEHSVIVSRYCKPENAMAGLMHDASEAYLPDVIRPIKPYLEGFKQIEDNLLQVIFKKYGIEYPFPKDIKTIDTRVCFTEGQTIMFDTDCWLLQAEPLDFQPMCFFPTVAELEFVERFNELNLGRNVSHETETKDPG